MLVKINLPLNVYLKSFAILLPIAIGIRTGAGTKHTKEALRISVQNSFYFE
jgi:hypothetical protein